MEHHGFDTDGSEWNRCTVHDALVFGDAYLCEGYEPYVCESEVCSDGCGTELAGKWYAVGGGAMMGTLHTCHPRAGDFVPALPRALAIVATVRDPETRSLWLTLESGADVELAPRARVTVYRRTLADFLKQSSAKL